jgi:hypothetical protein
VVEKGKVPANKSSRKKTVNSSKKGTRRGKGKQVVDSDSDHDVVAGLENELGPSPNHWRLNPDSQFQVDKDNLPAFTIKTRLNSASLDKPLHESRDTDDEQDELEPSPSKVKVARQPSGTKRKMMHDPLLSSMPKSLSRSTSHHLLPEVLVMIPSPKKQRLAPSSDSSV